jgi:hypothetical protein
MHFVTMASPLTMASRWGHESRRLALEAGATDHLLSMAREGVPNAQSAALECLRSLFLHSNAWELFCSKEGVRVTIRCLETGACDGDGNGVRVNALALLLEGCRASVIVRAEASRGGAGKVAAVLAMQVRKEPFPCGFLAKE